MFLTSQKREAALLSVIEVSGIRTLTSKSSTPISLIEAVLRMGANGRLVFPFGKTGNSIIASMPKSLATISEFMHGESDQDDQKKEERSGANFRALSENVHNDGLILMNNNQAYSHTKNDNLLKAALESYAFLVGLVSKDLGAGRIDVVNHGVWIGGNKIELYEQYASNVRAKPVQFAFNGLTFGPVMSVPEALHALLEIVDTEYCLAHSLLKQKPAWELAGN